MGKVFTQIGGGKVYRPWGAWSIGDSFQGVFTGTTEDNYGKTNWEFETEEVDFEEDVATAKKKDGSLAEYSTPVSGDIFVMNSCGSLDKAMENVDEGDTIKVVYEGTIVLNKGPNKGAEAHTMKIMRAPKSVKGLKAAQQADDAEDAL